MKHHFQHKTGFYKEGRLGYSPDVINLISEAVNCPGGVIADLGSGTGIFSAALLEKGFYVYCIEPDTALQEKAVENLGRFEQFTPLIVPAENTGLKHHSVNGITAASAFHWFDAQAFLNECRRILKPEGYCFFIYNVRQTDNPFTKKQKSICEKYCPAFTGFHHGADKTKALAPSFFSGGFKETHYPYDLIYTKEQFLARCLSSSYSPVKTEEAYPAYRSALEQLIESHSKNGLISIPNDTVVWYGKLE